MLAVQELKPYIMRTFFVVALMTGSKGLGGFGGV